jgi:hypothetical protein
LSCRDVRSDQDRGASDERARAIATGWVRAGLTRDPKD